MPSKTYYSLRPLLSIIALYITCSLVQASAPDTTINPATGHKHYEKPDQTKSMEQPAPRLQNLGSHTFPVSTKNPQAQLFINQGVNLAYAFNHAEAYRAFREAARLDPNLAMAYWGQALVLGPNINAMMEPNDEQEAYELVQKAKSLIAMATPREQALIDALEKRYTGKAEERTVNDQAYANAMRSVYQQFPDDLDIAMLYVEAVMDLRPWNYWMPDGQPYEGTKEIVAITEEVMSKNPKHPGALHMYIHLIEPTSTPERAEKAADTLLTLMPAAGHMVHMPSHIYQRVGRYADSMKSNMLAIAADEDYIAQCQAQGIYPMGYYPHNIHFLWFAATLDGQSKVAIQAARSAASKISDEVLNEFPVTAIFRVIPYWSLARFGRWEDVLKEPAPPTNSPFLTGSWHYVRGLAFVAMDQLHLAEQELASLRKIMQEPGLDSPLFSPNTARAVLAVGPEVLSGEILAAQGKFDEAIAHFDHAVRLEDGLVYTEPAEWHFPPRLALGTILLEAGRPAEAETVFWEDLRRNRNNGWALFGLLQALQAQQKNEQAALIESRFKKAWERADITLKASRFGRETGGM